MQLNSRPHLTQNVLNRPNHGRQPRPGPACVVQVLLTALALAGCSTLSSSVEHDIPNFKQVTVDPGVYRGGQPRSRAGWEYLQSIGISNVVKLNLETEATDNDARALGMTVSYFPISYLHQRVLKPDPTIVSNAVAAIKPGTYVHCKKGQDRTGLIVGCKRVWQEGWAKTNAWTEMIAGGFHPILRGLNDFWQDTVR